MLNLEHMTVERIQKHIINFWADTKGSSFDGMSADDCRSMANAWQEVADAFITQEGDKLRFGLCMSLVDIFHAKARSLDVDAAYENL